MFVSPLLLALGLVAQQPEIARPAFDWSQWGNGTRVRFRVVLLTPEGERLGQYSQRLVRREADSYTLEESMSLGGPGMTRDVEWRNPEVVGDESVSQGPEGCCQVWRATGRRDDELVEFRAWIPRGGRLPVWAVQLVGTREEASWQTRAFDETIRVPAGEFRCWRAEGQVDTGDGARPVTTWLHPDVPGGVVRTVLETEGGAMTFELEGFGTGGE